MCCEPWTTHKEVPSRMASTSINARPRRFRLERRSASRPVTRPVKHDRVDGRANFCGVTGRQYMVQGILHKVGIAEYRPVYVGVAHRLNHEMNRFSRVVAILTHGVTGQDIEDLAQAGPARARWWRGDDIKAAIRFDDWFLFRDGVLSKVFLR